MSREKLMVGKLILLGMVAGIPAIFGG